LANPVLADGAVEEKKLTGQYAHDACVERAERAASLRRVGADDQALDG
jgi:hypothetical protein